MGKSIHQEELEEEDSSVEKYDDKLFEIQADEYELYEDTNQIIHESENVAIKSNLQNSLEKINYEDENENEIDLGNRRKKKKRKRRIIEEEINVRDIIDIVVIILLVLILGVSLFRTVIEVQVQYKLEEEKNNNEKNNNKHLPEYEKINNKNNPKENYNNAVPQQNQKPKSKTVNSTTANRNQLNTPPKFNVSKECREFISNELKEKGNLYDFDVTYEEFIARARTQNFNQNSNTEITKEKYANAVDLLGLIHQSKFQGALEVQENPCEKVETKKQRLENAVKNQTERWNKDYNMDFYHTRQLRFCLVVNSYNNAKNGLIYRNIDSILQQNYTNYHVVYTDDHSSDETGSKIKEYLALKKVPEKLFHIRINEEQKGMMENIYNAIYGECKNGEIVVMIDGDDSLIGTNVLSLLNAVYQKEKPALLWSNFLIVYHNNQINLGFCRDYPPNSKKDGSFRKTRVLISSHLKTFFVDVFKQIKMEDLQTNEGKFYHGASDTAMMIPMLEIANPKIKYLPELLYEYRYDTGQIGNAVNKIPQKEALQKIFSSTPYKSLTDFSFVEQAIEKVLDFSSKTKE